MKIQIAVAVISLLLISGASAQQNIELINSYDLISQAVTLTDNGKYEEAIRLFKKVPQNDTNYSLASYEYAFCLTKAGRHEEAVAICRRETVSVDDNTHLFYVLMGNALDDMHNAEEALETFDRGIALFPDYYSLYYNKGVTLFDHERYNEAVVELKKALQLNPQHTRSHLLLAEINARHGRTVQAMLGFCMMLLLDNSSNFAGDAIGRMEKLINQKYEKSPAPLADDNYDFGEIQTLLESGIITSKDFKSKSKLNFDAVKSIQLLFESLKYEAGSGDYYMETYVKFFTKLNKSGFLVPYTYYILASYEIPAVQNYLKSKKKKMDAFTSWAISEILQTTRYRDGNVTVYYKNQVRYSLGRYADKAEKIENGDWVYYFSNGNKNAEGKFISGKKDGEWLYYHYNGNLRSRENFVAGKQHGIQTEYYESGKKSLEYHMKDDALDGTYAKYYQNGKMSESGEFRNGTLSGNKVLYFPNGTVKTSLNFVQGKFDGYNKECYPSGNTSIEATYVAGKYNGSYREYFENGKLETDYTYKNGKPYGPFKTYYYNGNTRDEGSYNEKGQKTGAAKSYYFYGTIEKEMNYSNGEVDGLWRYFDTDGILYSEIVYKNGRVASMKYFDKKGGVISDVTLPKGKQHITTYLPNGKLASEGDYFDNQTQGNWKYFNRYGVLTSEKQYSNGKESGKAVYYHPNGRISSEYNMKDDVIDGYYKSYYINGQLKTEGWYVNGMQQGVWKEYHINGKTKSVLYFLNDDFHGPQFKYTYNGDPESEESYENGIYNGVTEFDSSGAVWVKYTLSEGSGEAKKMTADGRVIEYSVFLDGERNDSLVSWYYANGRPAFRGYFENGRREGIWRWHSAAGSLSSEIHYQYGKQEGLEKFYFSDGKLMSELNYSYDKDNGLYKQYYHSGKLKIESEYADGERHGFRKIYNPDGDEVYHIFYNEGNAVYIAWRDAQGKEAGKTIIGADSMVVVAKFPSGKKSAEIGFKAGVFHGKIIEYYTSGKKFSEGNMYYGDYHGVMTTYHPDGKLLSEREYFYGNRHGHSKEYYANGKIKSSENFTGGSKNGWSYYYDSNGKLTRAACFYYDELIYEYTY